MLLVELPLFARSGLGVGIGINTLMSSGFKTFTPCHHNSYLIGIGTSTDIFTFMVQTILKCDQDTVSA